jgi:hypothetical protein
MAFSRHFGFGSPGRSTRITENPSAIFVPSFIFLNISNPHKKLFFVIYYQNTFHFGRMPKILQSIVECLDLHHCVRQSTKALTDGNAAKDKHCQ